MLPEERKFLRSGKWDESYDPYDERSVENGLTRSEGLTNVIKGCLGTGMLALPQAFYYAGMINGIVSYVILMAFGTYCMHLLVDSMYILCKIKRIGFLSYPKAVKAAFEVGPDFLKRFAPFAESFINIIFVVYQIGSLCVYVIFMGVNTKMVVDLYLGNQPLAYYLLAIFIPCALLILIPNIKVLSKVTFLANIATLVTIAAIIYYCSSELKDFKELPAVGQLSNFPLFIGTGMFALLSVPMIITVENNMADPNWFRSPFGALNVGFGIVAVMYLIIAIIGYWRYGSEIQSSITLNFPAEAVIAEIVRILYSLAILITFGLNAMIPRDIIWQKCAAPYIGTRTSKKTKTIIDYTIRIGLVVFCFILSGFIPLLGPVISLVGGVCLSLLGIILPAVLELCALWPNNFGPGRIHLWKDIGIFSLGFLFMGSSMYSSIRDIVNGLQTQTS